MKRSAPLIIVAALLSASVALAGPAERLVEAGKVFPMLDKFYAAPIADRSELAVSYVVTHDGKPAPQVHLALMVDDRRTPIGIAPDGRVERLPSATELPRAQIAVEAPPGMKLAMRLDLETTIKPTTDVSPAECALAVHQANAAIRRAAGVLALVAPKVKAATFPGAGAGQAILGDGKSQPLPLIKGAPAFDPDAIPGARSIHLEHAPSKVSLE